MWVEPTGQLKVKGKLFAVYAMLSTVRGVPVLFVLDSWKVMVVVGFGFTVRV